MGIQRQADLPVRQDERSRPKVHGLQDHMAGDIAQMTALRNDMGMTSYQFDGLNVAATMPSVSLSCMTSRAAMRPSSVSRPWNMLSSCLFLSTMNAQSRPTPYAGPHLRHLGYATR